MKIKGSIVDLEILKDIKNINATSESENIKNFIFMKGRILTCDEPNSNGDYFPKEEVQKAYRTFINKIVDFNHNENIVLGKIIDADFVEKSSKDNKACVEIISKINKNSYKDIVKQIESKILNKMSLEAYADRAECSICGLEFNFVDVEACDHIKGGLMREIEGEDGIKKLVFKKDYDLTFVGAGVVPNPADKKADIDYLLATAQKEYESKIKKAKEKFKNDKIEDAKKEIEPLVKGTSIEQTLKNVNALDFLNILNSIKNKWDGTTGKIAKKIASQIDIVTDKELSEYLSKNYDKLTTTDIDEIKSYLKREGKYIDSTYNAYFVDDVDEKFWIINKNNIPILKATLEQIWGEELEKDIKIDGLHIKDYAKSDHFRKNLLKALTIDGENYIKELWGLNNFLNKEIAIEDVIGKLLNIDLKDTKRILGNFNNVVELYKKDIKEINNPIVANSMEKFSKCVIENKNNSEIKAQEGQSKQDAVEAHCFKVVMVPVKASQHDIFEQLQKSLNKAEKDFDSKAWLEYKVSGKWPKNPTNKVMIKQFAIKLINKIKNELTLEEQKVIEGSAKYMKELGFDSKFIRKYAFIASENDIRHLIDLGLTTDQINELYSIRFIQEA